MHGNQRVDYRPASNGSRNTNSSPMVEYEDILERQTLDKDDAVNRLKIMEEVTLM